MLGDPQAQVVDVATIQGGMGQGDAELALSALAFEVHDQFASHRQSRLLPMVLGHQRQRQVQAGADARARPDPAAGPHEDRVGVDRDVRVVSGQLRGGGPVRGGGQAVQQPCLGEDVRADAHRRHAARGGSGPPHPCHHLRVRQRARPVGGDVHGAGDQQGVHLVAHLVEPHVGEQPHPGGRGDGAALGSGEPHVVQGAATDPVGQGEHLGRTGDVEQVDVREERDDDAVRGGHDLIVTDLAG
ncbi:hypothetical protein GCM10020219_097720 [Nonomuraea dietziae]